MSIKQFGSKSLTEVSINGKKILYSYQTPVVVFDGQTYFVTNKKFSKTTSRHISFYLNQEAQNGPFRAFNPVRIEQDQLEQLL